MIEMMQIALDLLMLSGAPILFCVGIFLWIFHMFHKLPKKVFFIWGGLFLFFVAWLALFMGGWGGLIVVFWPALALFAMSAGQFKRGSFMYTLVRFVQFCFVIFFLISVWYSSVYWFEYFRN
ncbi:MAG: hypothetical protein AAB372_02060 [Patescibacteria group bacterium]